METESPSASTEFLGTSIHLMSTTFDNVSKCGKFLITCQGSCVGWREAELGHFLRGHALLLAMVQVLLTLPYVLPKYHV